MLTLPNIITLIRLILIPLFGMTAVKYGHTIEAGDPNETLRWTALILFTVTATGDWLDGYLARKLNQQSKLGAVLDPLVDKVLMLVGLIVLSQVSWYADGWKIPVWYLVMVVTRDVSIGTGCAFILSLNKGVQVHPHWTGKATTFAQLFTLGWVMLQVPFSPMIPTVIAATLTLWSSFAYVLDSVRQLNLELKNESA